MVRSAVKPDGTHAVPRTRPHLNQIMVGLVLLSMGILIVYMYRIIDDLHNEQKDLRGQIVAMANREWPHLLSHPGSDKFLESKDEAVARSGQSNRFAKTMGSYEESRRPVEHIVEEVHPGYMAAFEVPRGDPESKRRLAGFYTIGTAAGVGCYEVADAATTTYDVSSATACSSNSCPDCFITPGTVSQDMTITINSCSSAQWIRSTTRTGIWEYKFINTHATYTMSITDNSGIGITYKVPPQSHVTAWCAASSGTADRLRFPSTTVPTLSVDSGFTLSAGAFDASASSGAFDTSSGTVTLRGNTVVNGANTFATGTGTVSLNGATTVADSTAFNVGATAGSGGVATFYGQVIIGASGNGQSQSLMLYGDFTQADDGDGTAKNFATATGTVTINGDISQASGKSITQSGAGAITSGSGAVQLNGAVTITGSNTFTSGTGTVTLKGNTLVDSTNTFTVGTAGSAGATILYGTLTVGDSTGTKEKLLKLIRSHPACVLALRLDVTMRISDEDIMEGLANSADNRDIDFRERMVPEEIIQEILNLRREARAEAALMSKIRRHNVWIVLIRLPLCASGILVFISLLLWLTTFEYTRAVCALYEFANATCSQANTCLFRVAVQLPGEEFSIFHPAWKMPAEEAYGTTIFAQNGPFKCCKSPRFYAGGAATTIEAIGAGTPCCDFLDENRSLFCDNFGDLDRRPHPVSDCPASPWHCGVKTEIIDRETHVKELRPWVEAPSLEIFLASLACLGTAGAVRLFPHFVAFMGRHLEHCAASFQIYARGAKRRLRRLRNRSRNRSSRLSTSSEAEVEVSERRTSRKAKAKATAKVREVEPEEVMSTDGSEVASRALQLMQPRASQQAANEVGFTVQPSPVVTVAVRAAKVQPQATHSSAPKTEPVPLEEILRPIITPAARLRSDNSRDRDHWDHRDHRDQAPRQPAAAAPATQHLLRAKARPRPRRAPHAVAPQATASPAKVMQMSQTQEQWMATSAQLRQLSQSQAPPPDLGIAPRKNKGRGTLPPATQI